MSAQLNELGFYTLAGAPESPRDMLSELASAEQQGLGSCFISERFNIKEALTLSGAAGAVTEQMGIATGVTNQNTKHPIVTAAHASTMHFLTGGRFALGLGRGIDMMFDAFGLPKIKTAQMEDFVGIMKRLWRGETIIGHKGPAGSWPYLRLDPAFNEDIPAIMSAFGPNSLALAGRAFDGVILHTFFTDETLDRCVRTVKRSAEEAGRDPRSVRVWSCFATVGDHISYPLKLKKTVGRMATYLQAYGDLLVKTNNWDPKVLRRFREHAFIAGFQGAIDQKATTAELELIAELIPEHWLSAAAFGSDKQCVTAINNQFDIGADSVILHGATPREIEPIVAEYRTQRNADRFKHLSSNPGKTMLS